MTTNRVPLALRNQLGAEATEGLVLLLGDHRKEWTADVMTMVSDRFERRLTDETAKVRVEMAQGFAGLRQEMSEGVSALRQEMTEGASALRQEMTAGFAALRLDIASGHAQLR